MAASPPKAAAPAEASPQADLIKKLTANAILHQHKQEEAPAPHPPAPKPQQIAKLEQAAPLAPSKAVMARIPQTPGANTDPLSALLQG